MEKLELLKKAYCMYLPYGVKCEVTDKGIKTIAELNGVYSDGHCVFHDTIESDKGFDEIKLILRPLSDLTKEIEINGEKINCLNILSSTWALRLNRVGLYYQEQVKTISEGLREVDTLPNFLVEILHQWHFDTEGLIEKGLAI